MPNSKSSLAANEKTYSSDYLMKVGIDAFTTNQAFSRVIELTADNFLLPYSCQAFGTLVPRAWHSSANAVAQLCQRMAQTLRTKGETPFVVNPLSHTIKQSTNLQSLQQFRWQLPSAYYRCLLLFHNPDRHRSLHWLLTLLPVPASPAKLYLLPYVVLLHMHRNDLLQYPNTCKQVTEYIGTNDCLSGNNSVVLYYSFSLNDGSCSH